jgi:hypothetical protein
VLELIDQTWVDDVTTMVSGLQDDLHAIGRDGVVFGPSLAGSRDVGKAEADLIAGDTLIEIKATKEVAPSRKVLCQIAAYLLLDYTDEYSIRHVGLLSGRWGTYKTWEAEAYLAKLAGAIRRLDLEDVRAEFESALRQTNGSG